MNGPPFEVDNLTERFGGFTAVDRVSFEIARGFSCGGRGMAVLRPQAVALGCLGGAISALSAMRFQKPFG